jgi:hypothetical protein
LIIHAEVSVVRCFTVVVTAIMCLVVDVCRTCTMVLQCTWMALNAPQLQ